ncbi:MAG: hypothetical protein K2L19_04655 [Eubacterium sp.]|nr:hypothetical protein [Eubacterium sp.]
MNIKELINTLNKNIPKEAFSIINGGYQFPSETYCLNILNGKFEYYYSERGIKTGLKEFDNENEACEYFYNELLSEFEK